jgi:hypothetical protein
LLKFRCDRPGGDPLSPGIDLDGDGWEVVLWGQGAAGRLLWYGAENGFALGGPAPRADFYYASVYEWRSDWNGDGRPDLAAFPTMTHGVIEFSVSLDERSLGEWQTAHEVPPAEEYVAKPRPIPIDVDGDGFPEVLMARRVPPDPRHGPYELVLRRRVGNEWLTDAQTFPIGGCGVVAGAVVADLDRDGDPDVVVADGYDWCDPFPVEYDPDWHRVGVFLTDRERGELVFSGWFAFGQLPGGNLRAFKAADADGDGVVDIVHNLWTLDAEGEPKGAPGYLRGHGDGTFETGRFVQTVDRGSRALLAHADFDGDGDSEWLAHDFREGEAPTLTIVEPPLTDPVDIALPDLVLPGPDWYQTTNGDHADFNGDGAADIFVKYARSAGGPGPGPLSNILLSAP